MCSWPRVDVHESCNMGLALQNRGGRIRLREMLVEPRLRQPTQREKR